MRPSTEIATALRWAGWGIVGFSALTLLVIILNIATGGAPDYGALIVPVLLATIGALVLIGARRVEDGSGPDAVTLGSWAFKGFGILCIGIGIVMTFEDPMAMLMLPFGAAFFGAGVLAKNIFGVPEGQKRIIIPDTAHRSHNEDGMAVQHRSGHIIHVDEDATEAEIEDSIRDWRRERLTDRKDWAAGRIEGESSRNFGWQKYAPMVTGVVALLMGTLAYFDGDLILWLIVSAFGAATVLATFHLFRDRQRLKAFGKSHLILDTQPAVIGQRLSGRIETGMSAVAAASTTCRLVLDCDLRWEETSGTGSEARKTLRSRRLWRDKQTARPQHDATTTKTSIPFSFDLPEDAKPSSLGSVNDGIRWLLEVTAELDGLDYVERFRVPVVAPGVL